MKKMQVLVDALPMMGLVTGIGRYLRNLYGAMSNLGYPIKIKYFDGHYARKEMPEPARPALWMRRTEKAWKLPAPIVLLLRTTMWLKYEYALRKELRKGVYHVYHESAFVPAAIGNGTPQVFTLHDLSLMMHPNTHPIERVWFFRLFFRRRIGCATRIITPSAFVKNEFCSVTSFPCDRVHVIPEAPDPLFGLTNEKEIAMVLSSLKIKRPYILFVGTLEPRKNLSVLTEVLPKLPQDLSFVIVGWKGWGKKEWLVRLQKTHGSRIVYPGYIDDHSLKGLYSGALALLYPSIYEGFGLPVLEAMACGCPVVCSNRTSLPEVAGQAALFVDPYDPEDVVRALENLYTNPNLRLSLIEKGLERVREFSWEKAAYLTVEVFRRCLEI